MSRISVFRIVVSSLLFVAACGRLGFEAQTLETEGPHADGGLSPGLEPDPVEPEPAPPATPDGAAGAEGEGGAGSSAAGGGGPSGEGGNPSGGNQSIAGTGGMSTPGDAGAASGGADGGSGAEPNGGTSTGGTGAGGTSGAAGNDGAGAGGMSQGGSAQGGSAAAGAGGQAGAAAGGGGTGGTVSVGGAGGATGGAGAAGAGGDAGLGGSAGSAGQGGAGGASGGAGGTGAGGASGGASGGSSGGAGGSTGCVETNGGFESCDGIDNDCDEMVDEGGCPLTCSGIALESGAYMLCDDLVYYPDAAAACAAQGLQLVKIEDGSENAALVEVMFPTDGSMDGLYFWIGLSRVDSSQPLLWADGTPLGSYTNWKNGPPGGAGTANCVQIDESGQWIPGQCDRDKRYVCEL